MQTKLFIPQNYKEYDVAVSILMMIFSVAIFLIFVLKTRWDLFLLLVLCDLPLFCIGLYVLFRNPGLYIENDKLIFKKLLKNGLK